MYERLLQEKQQQVDRVFMERDALQIKNKDLETQLEDARQQIDKLRLEKLLGSERSVTVPKATVGMDSGLLTPSDTYTRASVLPVNTDTWSSVSRSRRKLP